jgi:hypothetical protein
MGPREAKKGPKEPREVAPKGTPEGPRKEPRRGSNRASRGAVKIMLATHRKKSQFPPVSFLLSLLNDLTKKQF